jgi:hypothetical protein
LLIACIVVVVSMVGAVSLALALFLGSERAFVVFLAIAAIGNTAGGVIGVFAPHLSLVSKRLGYVLLLLGVLAFTSIVTGNVDPPLPALR